ncbi:MAG: redox-regulated ATPase YchF [Bacillota bacterium]
MKLGVVGLPNVGKSTLFNALTSNKAMAANYPFCTIEPNVGVVAVKDTRIDKLSELFNSKKTIYSTIEFVDIAGLVKGASKGEGLGNKFLSHIREVDAIVHVVRCFKDENITHVSGDIDPVEDIETINLELIFADIETLNRRIAKTKTAAKSGEKQYLSQLQILQKLLDTLESGRPVRNAELSSSERDFTDTLFLLTNKKVIYCANVSENADYDMVNKVKQYAQKEGSGVVTLCAKLEEELAGLEKDEKEAFIEELGLEQSGLDKLVQESYSLLNLISFLTAGEKESRAWPIIKGSSAPQAAGKIHTDFERGFIRAEVIDYDKLLECGSFAIAKTKGLLRSEGKDYIVKDGDVIEFRFNV